MIELLQYSKKLKYLRFENYLAVDWIQPSIKYLKDKTIKFIKSDIDKFKTKSKFNLIFTYISEVVWLENLSKLSNFFLIYNRGIRKSKTNRKTF